jgi:hypothetical protein
MLGLNYPMITALFWVLFDMMQGALNDQRHLAWGRPCRPAPRNNQASLVLLDLKEQSQSLLSVMVKTFEELKSSYIIHIYKMMSR